MRTRRPADCRCGTGSYCPLHERYGLPSTERTFRSSSDEEEIERIIGRDYQQCGGGRRLLRKQLHSH